MQWNQKNVPDFLNIVIVFLPLTTILKLLPLHSRITAPVQSHYRRRQVNLALDNFEEKLKSIYGIDHLTAMTLMKQIGINRS